MSAKAYRLTSLDGLRGIAALTVVLGHTALAMSGWDHASRAVTSLSFWTNPYSLLKFTPLRALVNGTGAVDVFFVLSGLVLALTLEKVENWAYGPYIVKRVARIYLPFSAAIIAAAVLWTWLRPTLLPSAGTWLNLDWPTHQLTAQALAGHLGMYARDRWLDNPMWSLVYELRVSIFFPVLAWCTLRRPVWMLVGWGVVAAVCTTLRQATPAPLLIEVEATLGISYLFVLGAALYFHLSTVRRLIEQRSPFIRAVALGLGLALLLVKGANPVFALAPTIGAVLVVAIAASHSPASAGLESHPARWLGKVSYSLYLTHVLVIQVVAQLVGDRMWLLPMIAIPVALLLAEAAYRLVEKPSMRLGRWLAARSGGSQRGLAAALNRA